MREKPVTSSLLRNIMKRFTSLKTYSVVLIDISKRWAKKVVQILTYNASRNMAAAELAMDKGPNIRGPVCYSFSKNFSCLKSSHEKVQIEGAKSLIIGRTHKGLVRLGLTRYS